MKSLLIRLLAASALLGPAPRAASQEGLPPQLLAARAAVEREIHEQAPGWVRRAVPPMGGSRDVVIDHWELGAYVVKVVTEAHPSEEEAADSLRRGRRQLEAEEEAARARGRRDFRRVREELPDVADGGYAWADAYGATAAAFKERDLTVYVSVVRPELDRDEQLSKEFAKHVAKALRSR